MVRREFTMCMIQQYKNPSRDLCKALKDEHYIFGGLVLIRLYCISDLYEVLIKGSAKFLDTIKKELAATKCELIEDMDFKNVKFSNVSGAKQVAKMMTLLESIRRRVKVLDFVNCDLDDPRVTKFMEVCNEDGIIVNIS